MDTLTPQQSAAADAIKQLRQRLLDLTNRNRLLNFRHTTNSRTHIRVIDELPDHICTVLVEGERLFFQSLPEPPEEPEDEKSDAFLMALEQARATDEAYVNALLELESEGEGADPDRAQRLERGLKDRVREQLGLPHWRHPASMSLADYARSLGWSPGYELPEPGTGTPAVEEHTDNQVRVLHLPAEMQRKLSGIYSNASTALKETGVNTLYVAFGFLEWRAPPPGPTSPMLAPLLLLPVEIDRQLVDGLYRYGIIWTGDEPEVNLTLSERLTQDFGLRLPDLDEDETPERYFAKAADRIRTQPGWRVRRFVTIGHFAFARLVMYQDLDEARWGGGWAKRELLARLLGGAEASDGVIYAPEYDVDEPSIAAEVPVLVADADSSQFSAIVDVMRGRDLALKGPPGTGKSQTITNTIAAALARGKRVLFVAEKMAALEVVKKRLDDAGLGDFCLELHSTKARKRDVLDSLQARIEITDSLPEPPTLDEALREIEQLKRRLTGYVRLINQPFGRLGKTIQEILWSEQNTRARAAALPDGLDNLFRADAEAVAPFAVDEARRLLDNAETLDRVFRARYGSIEAHPWYGVRSGELSIFGQEEVVRTFGRCREAASAVREGMEALARNLDAELCRSIEDVSALTGMLEDLPAVSEETIDGTLIGRLLAAEPRTQLAALLALIDDHNHAVTALSRRVDDVEAALGRAAEIAALAEQACALGCADARVAELPSKIEALAGAAEALARAAALAHRLRRLFGLPGPLTVHVVERLAQAAAFVAATPEPILQQRRPALVHPDGREAVRLAMEKASALKEQRRVLDSEMTIPADAAPQALRRHRDAVTAAGLFSFLRGSYRAARRAHRALRPGSRAKAPEMARDFERVAAHLEAVRDVEASVALRQLCGPRFAGLNTDFAALLDVVGFAEQVRRRFAGLDETSRAVRTALLDGDAGLITELAEIVRLDDFETLRATLATLHASVDTDLDAEVQATKRQVARLRTLETAARDLRLKADLAVGEGNMLAEGLRAIPVLRERIDGDGFARQLLGSAFAGTATDVDALRRHLAIAEALCGEWLPEPLAAYLRHPEFPVRLARLRDLGGRLGEASEELVRTVGAAERAADLDIDAYFGTPLRAAPLASVVERLDRSLGAAEELGTWVGYRRTMAEVEAAGLGDMIYVYTRARRPLEGLGQAHDRVLYRSLARLVLERYPELRRFSGLNQEQARQRFQELDRRVVRLNQQRLAAELCRAPVPPGNGTGARSTWTDLALIQHEVSKQRRHITIRDLLTRAGDAAVALKPCFMMSPLSVAQFLTPGALEFDLVVIDEASQMRPEEAIGAVARGRQIVVVGDPMQLPPTSFFDRLDDGIGDDDEEDAIDDEAILNMALMAFRPARELRWHYRSRHESLIAFSNKHFYDRRLIVFPSPIPEHPNLGVGSTKIDGEYRGRMNVPEAQAVAEAATLFMREHPDRTLGVVALNQPQRDLLQQEVERMIARDSKAAAYVERWSKGLEPFFIKNLENVQGDERDVIMVSTTYGPDESRRVMQRFGPINSNVGHRRLNVLFTRAKEAVMVFTSLAPNDIRVTETSNLGVRALKAYLEYATTGRLETGDGTDATTESPFEDYVKEALERRGFEVVPQVGVAGYRIDLGIRHPAYPNGFLLGIECDGATYHSSKSARDRDRLRQEVLERLGWQLYRVWSTDWFNDPRGELTRLLEHVHGLMGNVTPITTMRRA